MVHFPFLLCNVSLHSRRGILLHLLNHHIIYMYMYFIMSTLHESTAWRKVKISYCRILHTSTQCCIIIRELPFMVSCNDSLCIFAMHIDKDKSFDPPISLRGHMLLSYNCALY